MSNHCFHCNKQVELGTPPHTGRRDSCDQCGCDLHVCKNCTFYDVKSYNDCRESSADRVVDKEKSNYCDYFVFRDGKGTQGVDSNDKKKKLDDLFK